MSGNLTDYDVSITELLKRYHVNFIAKDVNANTITHYLNTNLKSLKRLRARLEELHPDAEINQRKVAMVSAIGSDMKVPGILARSVKALADEKISILAMHQCMRQVDMQFVVDEDDYEKTIVALHGVLIEPHNHEYAIVAA